MLYLMVFGAKIVIFGDFGNNFLRFNEQFHCLAGDFSENFTIFALQHKTKYS